MKLANHLSGHWQEGQGSGVQLTDPVTGEVLAHATSEGLDLRAGLEYARQVGNPALATLSYEARAALLGKIAEVLSAHRDDYFRISLQNSGATENDAAFDVDGAIYTIKTYARTGKALGGAHLLNDGARIPLAKTDVFQAQHYLLPMKGVAVFINAFNFPAWGLWEKAAPALLSGMPVFVKPATPTAWLAQRMVADVIAAGILPPGALSIVCGKARDLLDHLTECDVLSFTGSAETAERIRTHPAVLKHSVRLNIEADSVNAAILGPDASPGSPLFELLVREVVREMSIKAGQKCTAIRRILAPKGVVVSLGEAIASKLANVAVGNPRCEGVRMGPLVNSEQADTARASLTRLSAECRILFGGDTDFSPREAPSSSAFLQPTLLLCDKAKEARHVHETEVFGPVATLLPYADAAEAIDLARRGKGSLVTSLYSDDADFLLKLTQGIGDLNGRVMAVNSDIGQQHTGHGNVVPSCMHGGPGRAGGGEELGGLRGLAFYHRRMVLQGPKGLIDSLRARGVDAALLSA